MRKKKNRFRLQQQRRKHTAYQFITIDSNLQQDTMELMGLRDRDVELQWIRQRGNQE